MPPDGAVSRHWYVAVGGPWRWVDRLVWTDQQWRDRAADPHVQTWIAYVAEQPAGYAELQREPEGDVEIVYFGLLAEFTGQGLGAHFLSATIEAAWNMKARRVWVHTCTLDHAAALPNYIARGFHEYKIEIHDQPEPAT
jgi:GNAT superfamily N-acetyltransferase